MKIYIVGISCVGKSTIGKLLAEQLGYLFYDLDIEVQNYYQKPIERIQRECITLNGYREKASVVLEKLFNLRENAVISGTPSGLKYYYLQVYKKCKKETEIISVHLMDNPNNILKRLTFYDIDSNLMNVKLDSDKKKRYLKEIIADLNYFKKSLCRADLQINIEKMSFPQITSLIIDEIRRCIGVRVNCL